MSDQAKDGPRHLVVAIITHDIESGSTLSATDTPRTAHTHAAKKFTWGAAYASCMGDTSTVVTRKFISRDERGYFLPHLSFLSFSLSLPASK